MVENYIAENGTTLIIILGVAFWIFFKFSARIDALNEKIETIERDVDFLQKHSKIHGAWLEAGLPDTKISSEKLND